MTTKKLSEAPPMPKPAREFAEELAERVRRIGWSVDYIESWRLVEEIYDQAGIPIPADEDCWPYENDENTQ